MHELDADFEMVRAALKARAWPGVVESLSWGTPALKVKGKLLIRIREPDIVVLICDMDAKDFLMMSQPEIYFQTDHYKGYPAVLARLSRIDPEELAERIEEAWRKNATKQMIAEYDSRT